MKKLKRGVALFLILALGIPLSCGKEAVKAAEKVEVYITEGALNHALNRTMTVGETREGWKIELTKDRTVKEAVWTSSDTTVAEVSGTKTGAVVTTHKEGTAVITLKVVTNKKETVTNECLISSITSLPIMILMMN